MKKRILIRAAIGFSVGVAMGYLISWLTHGGDGSIFSSSFVERTGGTAMAWIVQGIVSGLYGSVCMAGTVCYDIEHWSLLRATLTHYLLCAVPYVPVSLLMGWAENAADILIMEAFQLAAFCLIWTIMYLAFRREVRELNELNNQRKNEDRKG